MLRCAFGDRRFSKVAHDPDPDGLRNGEWHFFRFHHISNPPFQQSDLYTMFQPFPIVEAVRAKDILRAGIR